MPGTGCQGLTIPEEECEQGIDELFLQYKPEGPIILWEELLWKEKGVALLGRGESGIPILPFGFLLFWVSPSITSNYRPTGSAGRAGNWVAATGLH